MTEEVSQQAAAFVVDRLLELANGVGLNGQNATALRNAAHLDPNPATEVQEIAARMLYGLAISLHSGTLQAPVVQPTAPETTLNDLAAEPENVVPFPAPAEPPPAPEALPDAPTVG